MKIRLAALTTAALAAIAAMVVFTHVDGARPVHAGGGGCPVDYAAGFYGFNGQSLVTHGRAAPAPLAVAGAIFISSDGSFSETGTVSGYETINDRGTVSRVDFTGTVVMVPNHCEGSVTITPSSGPTTHYDLVPVGWSNGGRATEVLFVQTDANAIGTLIALPM